MPTQTKTSAERAVDALRLINPENAALARDGTDASTAEWETIRGFDLDDRVTERADPQGLDSVAIFTDGSRIRFHEGSGRWVVDE